MAIEERLLFISYLVGLTGGPCVIKSALNTPKVVRPAPQAAFRHLTLDFVGPLPICKIRGFDYRFILQVVDRLTKRVWVIALERTTARETAEAFLNNVVRFAGLEGNLRKADNSSQALDFLSP